MMCFCTLAAFHSPIQPRGAKGFPGGAAHAPIYLASPRAAGLKGREQRGHKGRVWGASSLHSLSSLAEIKPIKQTGAFSVSVGAVLHLCVTTRQQELFVKKDSLKG